MIRNIYLIQLGVLALLGAGVGMVLGAAAPYLLIALAGQDIPIPQQLGIYPAPLFKALVLGLLSAALFFLPAIGRARSTPPSALFRMVSEQQKSATPWLERSFTVVAGLVLALVAMFTSSQPVMTFALLLGAGLSWGLFHLVAWGIRKWATWMARRNTGYLRLTLSNLAGPGSLAPTIVPALGLGLALLTLVVSVQSNLLTQISQTAPQNAPSLVFSQIPNDKVAQFDHILQNQGMVLSDESQFRRAPFILARVTAIKGASVDMDKIARSEQWVVRGETSLTYLAKQPNDTKLTAGKWWDEAYTGPLLVSVEADAAKGLRIGVGDTLTFRVFGREVVATVSSLRVVDWGTFSIGSNTAFILSPGTLEAAKPYFVAIAKTAPQAEAGIIAALGKQLPQVVVFQTRPALEAAAKLFADVALVVNGAAGVVTLAGLLVLLGTFAVMARRRQSEAALLKIFGAARREILQLYATEFALAGAAAAVFGSFIGVAASYPIVVFVFEAGWSLPIKQVGAVVITAILVAGTGGFSVGMATLARKPMRVLREH
ncbi:hypothetical protein MNBD_ALPHA06-929 [hydrothermal vent metagenome]|uniref:ABC3 transporter permease C-terminal domain-containing protein n=1 Tax=hydrothermal vent metagenome TaxID=652676 RepID=A0A3B0S789_9ZZZZ